MITLIVSLLSVVAYSSTSDVSCPSAYCSSCNSQECTECIDNYVLVEGQCVYARTAIEHCYKAKDSKCVKCFDGYYLKNQQCIPEDKNCDEYENGICKECEDGYTLVNGTCTACSIKGCEECKHGIDSCNECEDGYEWNGSTCTQPVPNCDDFEHGKCTECIDGYMLNGQTCEKIPIENCRKYKNGVCVKCFGPYKPINGTCTETIAQIIEHCIEYDDDEFECEECEIGYTVDKSETKCIQCDPSCKTCEDYANKCETCNEGYYIKDHSCIRCSIQSDTCGDYKNENQCYSCNNKCNWYNNACVESHCTKMDVDDDEAECQQCEDGYYLEEDQKICIKGDGCLEKKGDKCVKCSQGFFITSDFKCLRCSDDCKTCSNTASSCHSCFDKSSGISKVSCSKCFDPHCLECDESPMVCTKCNGNYTVNEIGQCQMGCFKEDLENKCTMCSDRQNEMNIYYPPTDEGICMSYSKMPNTPSAEDSSISIFITFIGFAIFLIF
ncbi:hypothetical protein, conserved [Entamoeba dispar SAW760]|uniref:Furin repeat-containing protein n=1 Tax=Entamoeba dispar (strain ATCC PRA-260 / SAW760) TaxID=370354 RepID=B0E6W1_ENTDS|nr:uncharacterized protein EDI_251380 [Entamoeba dispar SAW760]EDR29702.1 hypothetical protein, conserved [Entamoeba dispar SAW760]|eukprot:EDR29702.1 hypothetical protein, conserved [Entamoeba dispar SAW760]